MVSTRILGGAVAAGLTVLMNSGLSEDHTPLVTEFGRYAVRDDVSQEPWTIHRHAWPKETADLPVGVFDSGIGGLTVLEAILTLDLFQNDSLAVGADGRPDFEGERFVYLGDQANMPYGHYPSVNQQDFLRELILRDAAFLLGCRWRPDSADKAVRLDKPPVKAIVIACNTATAWGLSDIQELITRWQLPVFVVGVVDAGARGVLDLNGSETMDGTVAVMATVGTCDSNAYPRAISRTLGLAGLRVPNIVQQGSTGLAAAIEGDPAYLTEDSTDGSLAAQADSEQRDSALSTIRADASLDPELIPLYGFEPEGLLPDADDPSSVRLNSVTNYVRYDVLNLVQRHQASGDLRPISTVVLGCTHFPLVRNEILQAFSRLRDLETDGRQPFRDCIAESLHVVDPAERTARELFLELARRGLLRRRESKAIPDETSIPECRYFISTANANCQEAVLNDDGTLDRDYKYGRRTGNHLIEDTICVPVTRDTLPSSSIRLIRSKLPKVWQSMGLSSP